MACATSRSIRCGRPADPEHPEWANIVGALGNQYLREGEMFKGQLRPDTFLYEVYDTQPPGTSDTSRLSTDFINNPNAINGIFFLLSQRPRHREVMNDGREAEVPRRAEGRGGLDRRRRGRVARLREHRHLRATTAWASKTRCSASSASTRSTSGRRPRSAVTGSSRPRASPTRRRSWTRPRTRRSAWRDAPGAAALVSATPEQVDRGRRAFARECARCHSSKLPPGLTHETKHDRSAAEAWERLLMRDDFLEGNFLSDDVRYPIVSMDKRFEIGTNAARALATNAIPGHLWQDFSSRTYKSLPSPGTLRLYNPFDPGRPIEFPVPAGRGYYRPPSLIGVWATAPLLHNNALGRFTGDPSVEGRAARLSRRRRRSCCGRTGGTG